MVRINPKVAIASPIHWSGRSAPSPTVQRGEIEHQMGGQAPRMPKHSWARM